MAEQFANNASTTLNGAIDASTTSVTVSSAGAFPAEGDFRILVESEIMLVTAVSANTFTVTRGAESTTAASHSNGVDVVHILTAGALTQLKTDAGGGVSTGEGTTAARPAAGNEGDLYLGEHYLARDDGSNWGLFGPLFPMKPPTGSFSWGRQNLGTVATIGPTFTFKVPSGSGDNAIETYVTSAPSTPFTFTVGFTAIVGNDESGIGICERDSSSGKVETVMLVNDGGDPEIKCQYWGSETGITGNWTSMDMYHVGPVIFLRMENDGSTRTTSVSSDGVNFLQVDSRSHSSYLNSTDQLGIVGRTDSTGLEGKPGVMLTPFYWDVS